MKAGRPPLELGAHGKITTRTVASGHVFALARMRLWDGELHRVTATADSAPSARALLKLRMAERLRLSELNAWRYLTSHDPFGELTYFWLDSLRTFTDTPEATCARYERVLRNQLNPAFGHLTIGEITARRVEWYVAQQKAESEVSARVARDVLGLLLEFAVREGVIASNPVAPGEA
jgi:hypothetical protein